MNSLTISQIELIEKLLESAIAGELHFDEFQKQFSTLGPENETLAILYDDLENAVCHTPGFWLKDGIDMETWQQQIEYATIVCDLYLLDKLDLLKNWQKTKSKILETTSPLTYENIQEACLKAT